MFFPERITAINSNSKVLEIGPGGTPHPRSDVFLEKLYKNASEAIGQRGYAPPLHTDKEIIFYEGDTFPFNDQEFDYVICSHVLEHIENIDIFIGEINRIAKKGYLEYPTIYYDYIYNFPEHKTFLLRKNSVINWILKKETLLDQFKSVNTLFYQSLIKGYNGIIEDLKCFLFEGFEWFDQIDTNHVSEIDLVCYNMAEIDMPQKREINEDKIYQSSAFKMIEILSKLFNKIKR
jgi:SAM-dependent methyltransferase